MENSEETLESLREEKERILAELRRAQDDIKKVRDENKELKETGLDPEWKNRALRAEVRAALGSQGVKDTDRLMKLVNLEGLDYDEENNLTGLNENIEAVKNDFPELFDAKRRAGGKADIFADGAVKTERSASQIQADRILGR